MSKIDRIDRPLRPTGPRRAGRVQQTEAGRFIDRLEDPETGPVSGTGGGGTSGPVALTPLDGYDPLLALQEIRDNRQRESQTLAWGEELLAGLEQLRNLLLWSGEVPTSVLVHWRQRLEQGVPADAPSRLRAIVGEIEVRLAVEIAKRARKQEPES